MLFGECMRELVERDANKNIGDAVGSFRDFRIPDTA